MRRAIAQNSTYIDFGAVLPRLGGREQAVPTGAGGLRGDDALAQRVELRELGVDAVQDGLQAPPLGLAGGGSGVVRGECVDSVGQREPDPLQLTRELDALDRLGLIVAVAGGGALRRRQDTDALVEADRV